MINGIEINNVLHLKGIKIPINKKHLLITGKNGSGKTILLNFLFSRLNKLARGGLNSIITNENNIKTLENSINSTPEGTRNKVIYLDRIEKNKQEIKEINKQLALNFSDTNDFQNLYNSNKLILHSFSAGRRTQIEQSNGVEKLYLSQNRKERQSNGKFLKFLVHLQTQLAYSKIKSNHTKESEIETWFTNFNELLKKLFDNEDIELVFDEENYSFTFIEKEKEYKFEHLSDGYSSVLDLITELIMKMTEDGIYSFIFNYKGIVLIDEIETHLHIELQKEVLPMLDRMFPNVQFIVSTHSPFILNSMDNASVFDLEHKKSVDNLSLYSYDRIVETFLNNNKYSNLITEKINRYQTLVLKKGKLKKELIEEEALRKELSDISFDMAIEAKTRFNEIEINRIASK